MDSQQQKGLSALSVPMSETRHIVEQNQGMIKRILERVDGSHPYPNPQGQGQQEDGKRVMPQGLIINQHTQDFDRQFPSLVFGPNNLDSIRLERGKKLMDNQRLPNDPHILSPVSQTLAFWLRLQSYGNQGQQGQHERQYIMVKGGGEEQPMPNMPQPHPQQHAGEEMKNKDHDRYASPAIFVQNGQLLVRWGPTFYEKEGQQHPQFPQHEVMFVGPQMRLPLKQFVHITIVRSFQRMKIYFNGLMVCDEPMQMPFFNQSPWTVTPQGNHGQGNKDTMVADGYLNQLRYLPCEVDNQLIHHWASVQPQHRDQDMPSHREPQPNV